MGFKMKDLNQLILNLTMIKILKIKIFMFQKVMNILLNY